MRKRRLRLALLALALVGVVAWLVWPTSAVITSAREKYARLQLGMADVEVVGILGVAPDFDHWLYGTWMDDRKLYEFESPQFPFPAPPGPTTRLLVGRSWTFGDQGRSGWSRHTLNVQGVFDQGRLVCLQYSEEHDNAARRWLRELAAGLSFRPTFLAAQVKTERQDIPPP